MGSWIRIFILVGAAGALVWASGVRVRVSAVAGSSVGLKSARMENLLMKDGARYAGRVTEENEQQVMIEIEKGVVLGLSKNEIQQRETSSQMAMPVVQGPRKDWFSYDPGKNYFRGIFDEISRLYHGLFDSYESPGERKAHAERWAAGMRWQTGGREKYEQAMDEAARRSLGPLARYMDAPKARDMTPEQLEKMQDE